MFLKKIIGISFIFFSLTLLAPQKADAQMHSSISLENQVYYILEQAELRGLISPLTGSRPYTRSVVLKKINEIFDSAETMRSAFGRLSETEREILNQYIEKFSVSESGLDLRNGRFSARTNIKNDLSENDHSLSLNIGVYADIEGSAGIYSDDNYFGTDTWLGGFINGDLGKNFSYELNFRGGLIQAPRLYRGEYNTYYEGFDAGDWNKDGKVEEYKDEKIDVYSEPLTHFPYSYRKKWDGSVYHFSELDYFSDWPEDIAGAYSLPVELSASFIDDKLIMRVGRISREWGSTSFGSSLSLNQTARPFLALEAEFNPVSWFSISSMTGALEYYNFNGIKESSEVFQNMFSVTMMQFRYKNYLFFEITDGVVYPKRFELGYIVPIVNSFLYQNNIGDFDNMAVTLSLRGQIPGIVSIWGSIFVDEMNLTDDMFTLDRQMLALQGGLHFPLPFLSFTSLKISYTRINPYCYTHNRNLNPWYGDLRMETAYVNNGKNLGYYLPPNSDELLVRFETMPVKNLSTNLQYQLIRHGADFGSNAVDGSNVHSELDPEGRSDNPILKRFFLQDGAYQWNHIVKVGFEWSVPKLPVSFFGEAGAVISFFTDIDGEANSGEASSYSRINTSEYPESTAVIIKLGVRIFPKW